jgi:hypothetical protein
MITDYDLKLKIANNEKTNDDKQGIIDAGHRVIDNFEFVQYGRKKCRD